MTTSQELDRAQERADKTAADLRRTEAELRVTRVSKPKMHPTVCLVLFCFVVNLFVQKVAVPLEENTKIKNCLHTHLRNNQQK